MGGLWCLVAARPQSKAAKQLPSFERPIQLAWPPRRQEALQKPCGKLRGHVKAARQLDFEKAARLRDELRS